MVRTGIGFDSHRFAVDRPLILGGVRIPWQTGLEGHSDADVLCHALMDALLGAAALGDIGRHFPATDPQWKDARSLDLLANTAGMLRAMRYALVNADATIIAQEPRLAGHIDTMRANLSSALNLGADAVSVKASTAERMGALGRGEGIAVLAVVTIVQEGTEGEDS
jgi:2-C-methyl-D-erythritol 2,4-cyclodiphosphate synthase